MMSPEEFLALAKAEQDKWINPVGRLMLAAASIEMSVNELLIVLAPDDVEVWRKEPFNKRVQRISDIAKSALSDTLAEALKDQQTNYLPVMGNRNAIAHNPLYLMTFARVPPATVTAIIRDERKGTAYTLADVRKFADEADAVSAELMRFAANFPKALQDEIAQASILLTAMHCYKASNSR